MIDGEKNSCYDGVETYFCFSIDYRPSLSLCRSTLFTCLVESYIINVFRLLRKGKGGGPSKMRLS